MIDIPPVSFYDIKVIRRDVFCSDLKGGNKMVAGHLSIKNDTYYMVINYKNVFGERRTKWKSTGLPVRGNKKNAEEMLMRYRLEFEPEKEEFNGEFTPGMLFSDYIENWLKLTRGSIEITTYASYSNMVNKKISPYFRQKGIILKDLNASTLQSFILHELETLSSTTVIHEQNLIHKALKYAVKMDLILSNPCDKVDRPKPVKYIADYYRADELAKLFEVTKDDPLGLVIQMTAFYGFRRSEIIGLKWNAIDFERNTITVRHTVTEAKIDGRKVLIQSDRAKTKSSLRTLPLTKDIKEKLLALKETQAENMRVCKDCYNKKYRGYIFVDPMGNLYKPSRITGAFPKILEKHGLRKIRFHDLRHSCASLLLANGVQLKQIQEWLGHSDIATTANIYSHLDFQSKVLSANVMENALSLPEITNNGNFGNG